MIRAPGLYAVVGGEQVPVSSHGTGFVRLPAPGWHVGTVRHEIDELDDVLSVKVVAQWRGGPVAVSAVSGYECGFFTNDGALAAREGLAGDFHNGWHGAAQVSELTDVVETATSLKREPS
jgi:hypothetical protein